LIDFSEQPLVETTWLAAHLGEPNLRIIDARWRGDGTGPQLYRTGHIPGAVYLAWDTDLTHTVGATRWLNLPPDQFEAVMAGAGIGNNIRVVTYTDTDHSGAARLWWALRYYGHDQVAVLNGGYTKWLAERHPASTEVERPPRTNFTARPQPQLLATTTEIVGILNNPGTEACLVDTRPPEQYAGQAVWSSQGSLYLPPGQDWVDVGGRAMRGGRIPGAISQHAVLNLVPDNNWCYHSPEALRAQAIAAGIRPNRRVITYCGCGISAALGLFALYVAGYRNLALYDASWEEWGSYPSLPIEHDEVSDQNERK
jgi:thiosulfate/3-mercaptopyruvate sulfurtransferase